MKGVVIRLLNEDTNALEMGASHGLSEAFLSKGFILVEKSVTEVLQGKILVIEDVSKEKRLQYPKETKEEGINFLVCPHSIQGKNYRGKVALFGIHL